MPAQETAKAKTEVPLLFSKRLTVLNRIGFHPRRTVRRQTVQREGSRTSPALSFLWKRLAAYGRIE